MKKNIEKINSTTEDCIEQIPLTKEFPAWAIYSLLGFRIVTVATLLGLLIATFYFDNVISYLISEYIPVRRNSIYSGIAAFRVVNNLYVPAILCSVLIGVYFTINQIFKTTDKFWIYVVAFSTASYLLFSFFFFELPLSFIAIFVVIVQVVLLLNKLTLTGVFAKVPLLFYVTFPVYLLLPFVAELIFPSFLLFLLRNTKIKLRQFFCNSIWDKVAACVIVGISINLLLSAYVFWNIREDISKEFNSEEIFRKAERIAEGDFYNLRMDGPTGRLFATEHDKSSLYVFDTDNLSAAPEIIQMQTKEFQDMALNEERRELYHFDRGPDLLLVYNLDTFQLQRKSTVPMSGQGSTRVAFDNLSRTIAITHENNAVWIADMDSLLPIKQFQEGDRNECIVFSEKANRYILSYFKEFGKLVLVPSRGNDIVEIDVPVTQGGVAVSNSNNEFYVAFPLEGKIHVFDLESFAFKRKISTVFGVRGIAYDEKENIIIAASMSTGYVDVIDVSTEKRLSHNFVGYYLREVSINNPNNEVFISSFFGGIYRMSLGKGGLI